MPWRTLSRTSAGEGGDAKNLARRWLRRAFKMILSSTSVMFITCATCDKFEAKKRPKSEHHENVVAKVVLHHPAQKIEGQICARVALSNHLQKNTQKKHRVNHVRAVVDGRPAYVDLDPAITATSVVRWCRVLQSRGAVATHLCGSSGVKSTSESDREL